MALGNNLVLFPNGIQASETARAAADAREAERRAEAERLQQLLLDREHTNEIYRTLSTETINPDELMPTPDEVAARWGNGDYKIYDEMKRNVLAYGALWEGVTDVMTSLALSWLPGMKGDPESEQAALEVATAWQNIIGKEDALRAWCGGFETGFAPVEAVFGVHTRGVAQDLVSVVEYVDRPISWYGFDKHRRPRFKRQYLRGQDGAELVPEYKVHFVRYGSGHTPFGKGKGQFAYPTVWAMDMVMKGYMQMTERFGWLPAVVTYPDTWKKPRAEQLRMELEAQWRNVLLIPGDVDRPDVRFPSTDAAYAAANASGQARMAIINKYENWLAMWVQGSMYSSGNSSVGAYARDKVADNARMWKAPGYASCLEATLNRGFVRPTILANRPTLVEAKWPRASIDASFGEDLSLLLQIMESAAKMKVPISHVTFSERFKLPLARDMEPVLAAPAASPVAAPGAGAPVDPETERVVDAADEMFGEQNVVTIHGRNGQAFRYFSDTLIYVEGRGIVPAGRLGRGDVVVEDPARAVNA